MLKPLLAFTAIAILAIPAQAQRRTADNNVCPAGTRYATIRHVAIKPGKWATFAKAVGDHGAWYAAHKDGTRTAIGRIVAPGPRGGLSSAEAVTITRYSGRPHPARDAAYAAFTAEYRASSTIKDEMRACLPA